MKVKDRKFYKCLEQILDKCIKETNNEENDDYCYQHYYTIIRDLRSIFKHRKITLKNTDYLYGFLKGHEEYYTEAVNKRNEENKKDEDWTKEHRYVYKFLSTYLKFKEIKQNLYISKHIFWDEIENENEVSLFFSKREGDLDEIK